ncbi:MAG: tetratricopeptide repeat protein [Candidatus Eisenbacteria bacterium]|nr:tetratricopeptide repeat protein [Candidatus Eisenbacteria bacterium]
MSAKRAKKTARGGERDTGGFFSAMWCVFLLLHVAASYLWPDRIWGAHHLGFLPAWFAAAWVAVAAAFLAPATGEKAGRLLERGAEKLGGRAVATVAASVFAFLLFLLFRSRNLFLGDGWLLSGIIDRGDAYDFGHAGFFTVQLYEGALALFRAVRPAVGAAAAMALVNALFGVPVLLLAPRIAAELVEERRARVVVAASILLSGGIFFFFGHVENYTPMQAAALLFLWASIRFLRGRSGVAAPTAALVLAVLLHHTAAVFAPAWFVLLLTGPRLSRNVRVLLGAAAAAAATAGALLLRRAAGVYSDGSPFLPLLEKGSHSWTFLSPDHLSFLGNLLLLLLGGALLFPFLRLPRRSAAGKGGAERRIVLFLAVSSGGGLLFPLLTDPLLGARDWDLMALSLFPLLLFLAAFCLSGRRPLSTRATSLLVGAMLLHTVPWIAVNTGRDRAVRMTLAMVARDPHYANPELRAPTALAVLLNQAGYAEEAEVYLQRSLKLKSRAVDYVNLGKSRGGSGDMEGAIAFFLRALESDSTYADAWLNLAVARVRSGDSAGAERDLRRLLRIEPDHLPGWMMLGNLLGEQGRIDETEAVFERCVELDDGDASSWEKLGILRARAGKRGPAMEAFRRAIRLDPKREQARSLLAELERMGEGDGSAPKD